MHLFLISMAHTYMDIIISIILCIRVHSKKSERN